MSSPYEREVRIMIVDDDPGTVRVLAQILQEVGKVHFTTQAREALGLARQLSPDIILLDIEMPDMNGIEVCEQIRREPGFGDVPIVFVTSISDMDMEARALSAGAIDFVQKPPNPLVVRARIRNYLNLKLQTDRLRMLSTRDGLTNIANRRAFDEACDQECRRACRSGKPLSLLMIDVDHFKRYNDTYGHQAGDDCLRAIATTLADNAKRPGEMAARYGGEEFAVLLPNCTREQAWRLAEGIRAEVAALAIPHATSSVAEHVTASLGIATLPPQCSRENGCWHTESARQPGIPCVGTPASLIKAADAALYEAKKSGRNRVWQLQPTAAD